MLKLKSLLVSALLLAGITATAQQITVTGTVTSSADGYGVIGAAVMEKGTSNGTTTDFDGNFTISVKQGAVLVFSSIGYTTQELPAKAQMAVVLDEDSQLLNEVVVTGYTVQRKADLTGAISTVNTEDLAKQNENNPVKALQGRVPGMNISADGSPSGAATVRIRGVGSLNDGANDPLFIIDGVPTKAGMHELNGNDIESIQVLKDAASASIYGSRAANGVIIITTKNGKDGKVKVDFDASVAAQTYANRMQVLNAEEFGRVMWQGYVNDGLNPERNSLGYHFDWGYDANGVPVLNKIRMDKYLDAAGTTPASDTDWVKETTRTGLIQQYNLSLSNGTERGNSYFSLGYYRNDGIIKHSDFSRISARINTDYKLLKVGDRNILTIGEHFTLNRTSEVQAPGGFLENVLQFNPSIPVYTTSGEFAGPVGGYPDRENPLARLTRNKDNRYSYWRLFGDAYLNINPVKGLNIKTTFGIDYSQKEQRIFTYPVTEGTVATKTNAVEAKQEHWLKWMWNAIATYNFEVGKHRGDILVGTEVNREDDTWFSGKAYDFAVLNPDYMWPNAAVGEAESYGGGGGYTLISYFGKVNYNYADRYLASVTLRYDGSSRFGRNTRFGLFPSVSVGWRIDKEKFMENALWLDNLKIRASWGQTGTQDIDNIARYSIYESNYGEANFGGQSYGTSYDIAGTNGGQTLPSGFRRIQLGNDNLKWETTTQTNVGLDFAMFKSALYGSLEVYYKKTTDILVRMPGIGVMGEGADQWINAGEMDNKGIEFNVGYRGEIGDFQYDLAGNIGTYRNRVTKLPETLAARGDFGGNGVESVVGHPMGAQVGYVYDGIFKSQDEIDNHAIQSGAGLGRIRWKDLNDDGVITEKDQKWIYSPVPDFTWGLNIYLQYKNFDLTMFWQGVQGVDVITSDFKKQTDLWTGMNISNLNKGRRLLDAWSPNNMASNIPAVSVMDNNNEKRVSSYYVENGSFAKLRTIQLGYNFSGKVCEALHMSRLRVYVSAQNLFTIRSRSFTGVDPENPTFGYPIPLNITAGINVSF
ncbi:MAG: TonB-dependent receptor [Bacteroidales bacterium]|nr:TonB-dependent receptor [Bacteroidales bacterium]